ncbi:MAG TPA: hypothetical protein VKI17_02780, partial [Gemmataceae bacterium]|nr:hypothetical protein [Gemmataceae bacterium]
KLHFLRHCESHAADGALIGSWAEDEIADVPDEAADYWLKLGYAELWTEPPPKPRISLARPAAG